MLNGHLSFSVKFVFSFFLFVFPLLFFKRSLYIHIKEIKLKMFYSVPFVFTLFMGFSQVGKNGFNI